MRKCSERHTDGKRLCDRGVLKRCSSCSAISTQSARARVDDLSNTTVLQYLQTTHLILHRAPSGADAIGKRVSTATRER